MIKRPIHLSHDFLKEILTEESIAVDATMGNGNDTAFLSRNAKKVYAFDIQEEAVLKTQRRLEQEGLTNAQLILKGHENVAEYVDSVDAAIFNLGYLPSADKSVITKPDTTLKAIESLLSLLTVGGRISIMIYYGHEGGDIEKDAVLDFVSQLNQEEFATMLYRPLNQINQPPFLVMIEKLC